jgi:UPF0716 protein FxsA
MQIFFAPLLFLPVIEILGFMTIGAKIGLLGTLVWLFGASALGFRLLRIGGLGALSRARSGDDAVFAVRDAFDSLCLLIAAALLLFPGFISDFIAIPFLLSPVRHMLFGQAKDNPDNILRRNYRNWTAARPAEKPGTAPTIEGEFRRIDETERKP